MTELRYPVRVLLGDYLRAASGLFVGLGVLAMVPPSPVILAIFGSLALLFGIFGLRTIHRHLLRVRVSQEEIACQGLAAKTIPWQQLDSVRLRYFGTRRTKWRPVSKGFMQLTLKGAGTGMTFESSIEDFDQLAAHAAAALRSRGLVLEPATTSNLIELGIDPEAEPENDWKKVT